MLKVGLLGAGRIGQVHAVNIDRHRGSCLAAVSDVRVDAAKELGAQFGAKVASSDEILADSSIDAVLIASSTDTHADLIEGATAAGKAVLCEKPVDLALERARACAARVAEHGQPVMIGFQRRFDPNFGALKAQYQAGRIGKAEMLSISSFDPSPPPVSYIKVSGGLFRDMMIHDFDVTQFVMGDAPETVSAVGRALVDPAIGEAGDVDTAAVTMTYADGRIAIIRNSRRASYGYDQRLELLGSEGMLRVENILENTVVCASAAGIEGAKPEHSFLERYLPAYAAEWEAFVSALEDGSEMPVTLEEGVQALAMAEAATRSATTGLPVKLEDC